MDHHAYCYIGHAFGRTQLHKELTGVSPDIIVEEYADFGINEARRLSDRAYRAPLVASKQQFVLFIERITPEAQNALLKVLEEPPQRSVFHVVVPKLGLLLPTLQSRFFMRTSDTLESTNDTIFADFQAATYGERLALVADIAKQKDTVAIESLLAGAEAVATKEANAALVECVLFVREHIAARGASKKMLLELLALRLP